jgi:hypothetical protein
MSSRKRVHRQMDANANASSKAKHAKKGAASASAAASSAKEDEEKEKEKEEQHKDDSHAVTYPELENAANKYALIHGTTPAIAMREFVRLMEIKAFLRDTHGLKVSPSRLMDSMWHAAILDTEFYAGLQVKLGMLVHHRPNGALPAEDALRKRRLVNLIHVYGMRYEAVPFGLEARQTRLHRSQLQPLRRLPLCRSMSRHLFKCRS